MRPPTLDPRELRKLRQMSPVEKLELAFGLTEMADELAEAGARHRAETNGEP
jgi:hypothetical protein